MTDTVIRPAPFDVGAAWAAYQKLATQLSVDPELRTNAAHCALTARAYRHWQNLFLAGERA